MSEQKLREALQQAVGELEFSVAIIGRHYQQRAESMSMFLSEVRELLAQPTSDEGTPFCDSMSVLARPMTEGEPVQEMLRFKDAQKLEIMLHARIRELNALQRRLLAALPSGYVQVPRFLAENFLRSTDVPRFKRILEAALAATPTPSDSKPGEQR